MVCCPVAGRGSCRILPGGRTSRQLAGSRPRWCPQGTGHDGVREEVALAQTLIDSDTGSEDSASTKCCQQRVPAHMPSQAALAQGQYRQGRPPDRSEQPVLLPDEKESVCGPVGTRRALFVSVRRQADPAQGADDPRSAALIRMSSPICSQVASFHCARLSPMATAIHSASSVRLIPASTTRQPRSTSRIRAAGRGSLTVGTAVRAARREALSAAQRTS